jgi:uncharacterized protein (DUF433 family)
MTLVETTYEHIAVDDHGVPWIEGANMKVVELVLDQQAYGGTPEILQEQHPTLTFGQIYSALAYYWDHKDDLDADIQRRLRLVDEAQREHQLSPFEARLKREAQKVRSSSD